VCERKVRRREEGKKNKGWPTFIGSFGRPPMAAFEYIWRDGVYKEELTVIMRREIEERIFITYHTIYTKEEDPSIERDLSIEEV
jgi:hypothetical protein